MKTSLNTLTYTDQLGRKIQFSSTPKRIISLVPSQTEMLFDFGLNSEVVGITKFCIHPNEWYQTKDHIGGTKNINFEKIKLLKPDLIIGNKEENNQKQLEELMKHYNVWVSDIYTLKDSFDMITRVGTLLGKQEESTILKLQIESLFNQLKQEQTKNTQQLKVAYFIWQKPYMVASKNTFINDMINQCGFTNAFDSNDYNRYPEVNTDQIASANPELILLSSEPYPFKEKHIKEFQAICPNAKVLIVDGEMFSWYGSRLMKAPNYFKKLIDAL